MSGSAIPERLFFLSGQCVSKSLFYSLFYLCFLFRFLSEIRTISLIPLAFWELFFFSGESWKIEKERKSFLLFMWS